MTIDDILAAQGGQNADPRQLASVMTSQAPMPPSFLPPGKPQPFNTNRVPNATNAAQAIGMKDGGRPTLSKILPAMPAPGGSSTGSGFIPDDMIDAIKKMTAQQQQGIDSDQQGLNNMKQMALAGGGFDLKPLAALADSWSNNPGSSHLAASLDGQSPEEKLAMMDKLQNYINQQHQNQTKDMISLAIGEGNQNQRNWSSLLGAGRANDTALLAALSGRNDYYADRDTNMAADVVNKAPNMKAYTDLANGVGEAMYLAKQPDATVIEAHEAMQRISNAINRSNATSDYKQKQLDSPTVQEYEALLTSLVKSDPNQKAPPKVMSLIDKIGNRVLDTYGSSITREALRSSQGRHYQSPSANDALSNQVDYYKSGRYMRDLRDQYQLGPSALSAPGTLDSVQSMGKRVPQAATPAAPSFSADNPTLIQYQKAHGLTSDQAVQALKGLGYAW